MENIKTAVYNSTGRLKRVLLGKPTYHKLLPISDIARNLHDSGKVIDKEAKDRQHSELEQVFVQLGIDVRWVELNPEFGWQASTRDQGVNTPEGILIGRFRYSERKGEEVYLKRSLEKLGEKFLPAQITRGAVEGGDCFCLDENTLIIGNGNRSTYAGFENAKEILSENGIRVFVVEFLSKWNHLDVIFMPIADKLAIVCIDAVPGYLIGFLEALNWELIRVSADYAWKCEINMLALGDDKVISFKGNRINDMLKARGLEVYDPEFNYYTAQGIGPHCSTLELERDP